MVYFVIKPVIDISQKYVFMIQFHISAWFSKRKRSPVIYFQICEYHLSISSKDKCWELKYFIDYLSSFTEEPPKLTRTKTTVSTDYQFSACYLTQLGTSFSYDYEYNGPSCRLVLTPLTERAFLSLTQAIKNFHCGTLVGPAGVGKSETIKELAKVIVIMTVYEIYPAHKSKFG